MHAYTALSLGDGKLPVEILQEIFLCVCRDPSAPRPSSLIRVSHVCQLWRDIALRFPALWTHVVLGLSDETTATLLRRAGTRPLTFEYDLDDDVGVLAAMGPYVDRVVRAHVLVSPAHRYAYCFGAFLRRNGWRALESVTVRGVAGRDHSASKVPVSVPPVHIDLQTLCLPKSVTTLELDGVVPLLRNNAHSCLNLRSWTLAVRGDHDNTSPSLTFARILDVLRHSPAVEILDLSISRSSEHLGSELEARHAQIRLDALRSLTLSASAADVKTLLGCLVVPASARVHLEATDGDGSCGDHDLGVASF